LVKQKVAFVAIFLGLAGGNAARHTNFSQVISRHGDPVAQVVRHSEFLRCFVDCRRLILGIDVAKIPGRRAFGGGAPSVLVVAGFGFLGLGNTVRCRWPDRTPTNAAPIA